jgi:hypothetical protein
MHFAGELEVQYAAGEFVAEDCECTNRRATSIHG